MSNISRRGFVAVAGGTVASAWLTISMRDLFAAGEQAQRAQKFEVLSEGEAADLEAATSHIVPTDDTPGAREARVVYFVDHALATFYKEGRKDVTAGVKELRTRAAKIRPGVASFAALSSAEQVQVIASMEKDKHAFFNDLIGMTVAGMVSAPERGGNKNKVGWKWIGFEDRFSWAAPFGWYDRGV